MLYCDLVVCFCCLCLYSLRRFDLVRWFLFILCLFGCVGLVSYVVTCALVWNFVFAGCL